MRSVVTAWHLSLRISLLFLLTFTYSQSQIPELRGVWLSRDVIRQGRSSIHDAFLHLKQAGFNAVFVNNWYQGSTIYPSQVLASYGGDEQLDDYAGWDPVRVCVEEGHALGLEVHLWFEYGLIAHFNYATPNPDPGPILTHHPEWRMKNRSGKTYATDSFNNLQFWLDPADSTACGFITELFAECARLYPELDGIQTDRIRYPDTSYSFSDVARLKYQQETGGTDPLLIDKSHSEWTQFISWRERQTSNLAHQIYQTIKSINPRLLVSAAVAPPYMLEGAQDKMQDWPTWFMEKSIDLLCPMLYGLHNDMPYWLGRCLAAVPSSLNFAAGVAIADLTSTQLSNVYNSIRDRGFAGSVVWYYGDLNESNLSTFENDLFIPPAPTLNQQIIVDDSYSAYISARNTFSAPGGYRDSYQIATSDDAFLQWRIPVFLTGNYQIATFLPVSAPQLDSLIYIISLNGNAESPKSVATNQMTGAWLTLGNYHLQFSDDLSIRVIPNHNNQLIADAVRLERLKPLAIVEGLTPDQTTLMVKFDRKLRAESAGNAANYRLFPDGIIEKATPDAGDPQVVRLKCSSLSPDKNYRLKAWDLVDLAGLVSDTVTFDFEYTPGLSAIIDDESTLFGTTGNWSMSADGQPLIGTAYHRTPAGDGTNRVFWRYPAPTSGYYIAYALFPDSSIFVDDAMYIVKNGANFDTVLVNQQAPCAAGIPLTITYAEKGSNLVVKLHNQSRNPSDHWVVADAVRFEKTFIPATVIDTPLNDQPTDFKLFGNFPNPFNTGTNIFFNLEQSGTMRLAIFDLSGRQIKAVVKNYSSGGKYIIPVALNNQPAGIYLYRISNGTRTQVGKMLLIK